MPQSTARHGTRGRFLVLGRMQSGRRAGLECSWRSLSPSPSDRTVGTAARVLLVRARVTGTRTPVRFFVDLRLRLRGTASVWVGSISGGGRSAYATVRSRWRRHAIYHVRGGAGTSLVLSGVLASFFFCLARLRLPVERVRDDGRRTSGNRRWSDSDGCRAELVDERKAVRVDAVARWNFSVRGEVMYRDFACGIGKNF
jgi:hypothetical protein